MTTTPTLVEENPANLIIGDNVRGDARLDKPFLDSVKQHGVLEPIVAYPNDDGQLVVVFGKRRVLAALKGRRPLVPVMVVAKPADTDRLVNQLVENERRTALTDSERVAGYEQLVAFGLSAAQIAKKTATPRPQVDAGLTTAGSETARAALQEHPDITLDQAAALAEFEDDPDAVKALQTGLDGGGFDHLVQRLRDHRAETAERAEHEQPYRDAGLTIVERPEWKAPAKDLNDLLHDGQQLTEETHRSCPGHAAYVDWDFSDEDPPEGVDEYEWEASKVWEINYVCTDPAGNGHILKWSDGGGRRKTAAMSDEERQQASDERREVIANNKAWASSEAVRRDWLHKFLAGRTAPKTAGTFIAISLGRTDHELRRALETGNKLTHELLGLGESPGYGHRSDAIAKALTGATEGRALMVALGLVLCAYEEATGKHSWRGGDVKDATGRYLLYLVDLGYELSDVEYLACGGKPKKPRRGRGTSDG